MNLPSDQTTARSTLADRRSSPSAQKWGGALIVIGLALGLAGAYALQPPFTIDEGPALSRLLLDMLWPAALTIFPTGLGWSTLTRLGIDLHAPGGRVAVAAAIGWGIVGLAWFTLGAIGWQSSGSALGLIGLVTVLGSSGLAGCRRDLSGWWRDVRPVGGAWLPFGFVLVAIGAQFTLALLPPTKWDALVYHLTLPQRYLEAGGWRGDTGLMFSGMPQLTEMVYGVALGVRGAVAAQLLGWAMGVVALIALTAVARALLGQGLAFWPTAVLVSAPTVAATFHWAYAEPLGMACSVTMTFVLIEARRSGSLKLVGLAGVLAGLAFGTKYTAGSVAVFGAVWVMTAWGRTGLRPFVTFLGAGLCLAAPWLLKNLWLTGSPIYPLFIPSGDMTAARQDFYNHNLTPIADVWTAVTLYAQWALRGREAATLYDATIGPLWVLLPALALASWWRLPVTLRNALLPGAVGLAVTYALWVVGLNVSPFLQQARLFIPMLAQVALVAGAGVAGLSTWDGFGLRVSWLGRPLLALALAVSGVQQAFAWARQDPWPYLSGQQSAAAYLQSALGGYAPALERIETLAAGSRVMFLWEPRSLACPAAVVCEPDELLDNWLTGLQAHADPTAVLSAWGREGYDYVLIAEYGARVLRTDRPDWVAAEVWAGFDAARTQLKDCEDFDGAYTLCRVPDPEADR